MFVIKKSPQYTETIDVSRESISKSFREIVEKGFFFVFINEKLKQNLK